MASKQPGGVFRCCLVSRHPRMQEVFDQIPAFGKLGASVLIEGESGTGKQVVARAIHESSARRAGPLVVLNCTALPEALIDCELFGHVKRAFAWPEEVVRPGAFEKAHGGTLLLAQVEDLPPGTQARLLRVLQERRFARVGDDREIEVDVRVIATTLGLKRLVDEGAFRPDLLRQLGALRLSLPTLRERPEDVPLLARHFAQTCSGPTGPPAELSPAALEALARSWWPGNVRELAYVIDRACILAGGGPIGPEHLPGA